MRNQHLPLPQGRLRPGVGCTVPEALMPARVRADSPAIEVMTDLRKVPAATIAPSVSLDDAQQAMIMRGVRLLLVTTAERQVVGMITAHDLMGERPLQIAGARGVRRNELSVADVMVAADAIDVIDLHDVLHAEVGHVVATLRRHGRQHAMVVDQDGYGNQIIRGIFSASQIARQLGVPLQTTEIARTFAEIESALARR